MEIEMHEEHTGRFIYLNLYNREITALYFPQLEVNYKTWILR